MIQCPRNAGPRLGCGAIRGAAQSEVINPEDSDEVLRRHMLKYDEFVAAVG